MLNIQIYNGFLPVVEWRLYAGISNDGKGGVVLVRKNYIKDLFNWDKKNKKSIPSCFTIRIFKKEVKVHGKENL